KSFAEKNSIQDILLVTSESHMRRAAALFRNQGLSPDIYSVLRTPSCVVALQKLNNYVPSPYGLKTTKGCIYELVGYLGYFIMGDI
ncbi:MAG: ElyC/SanA/YdcF family protein, partial [Candidatus Neomarinimicrobiota bacterium]|nr:ElyC/SanA/YdcF family protein [Candidatus Neomarinimicrobiota bacterium]